MRDGVSKKEPESKTYERGASGRGWRKGLAEEENMHGNVRISLLTTLSVNYDNLICATLKMTGAMYLQGCW